MHPFLLAILVLLVPQERKHHPPTPRPRLVLVTPKDWKPALEPYVELKKSQGLAPVVLEVESAETGDPVTWAGNLRRAILALRPDYVFLVGDATKVPVVYDAYDIDWSPFTKTMVLYSDGFFVLPEGANPRDPELHGLSASVGRLQAPTVEDVKNYVAKAVAYEKGSAPQGAAFLLGDRGYDASDTLFHDYAPMVKTLKQEHWLLNKGKGDGPKEAAAKDLADALDANAPFVLYVGHGSAQMWNSGSFALGNVKLTNARPVPLVLAIACETALGAPNIPWYPYYTSDGKLQEFGKYDWKKNGAVTREMVGDIHSLQACTTQENYSRRFTSKDRFGSMVYIGETIVTHANWEFVAEFLRRIEKAYATRDRNVRVGDLWRTSFFTCSAGERPWYFQLAGDPTTPLLPPGK